MANIGCTLTSPWTCPPITRPFCNKSQQPSGTHIVRYPILLGAALSAPCATKLLWSRKVGGQMQTCMSQRLYDSVLCCFESAIYTSDRCRITFSSRFPTGTNPCSRFCNTFQTVGASVSLSQTFGVAAATCGVVMSSITNQPGIVRHCSAIGCFSEIPLSTPSRGV